MNESKKNLQGSKSRDIFKRCHKGLSKHFYSSDLDFVWLEKYPPGIVAFVDYKKPNDIVTFSEVIAYNALRDEAPIYLVYSHDPETGPFTIRRYISGDWRPEPPVIHTELVLTADNWEEFGRFEEQKRNEYRQANSC